ncbi:hypothetical protein XBJ2_1300029 [Xenorhabdus bovienii str. Jollieti]|uniref:Uncharacterized protein n=1 Tax=Xenorhabdus bovienii (strain SS-2004) TaxID=406818 RepID=D3V1N9_XENBS|nr:hypothetical protein XBJ1_2459 [Xenorhabdus bovienii SS-2004]CDH27478.1 hypothetical protein XBJ2_1300029 [Xenorhabdus bovienii str. Jollieti]
MINFIFLWFLKRQNEPSFIVKFKLWDKQKNVSIFKTEFTRAKRMVTDGVNSSYIGIDSTLFSTCDEVTALCDVYL